MSRQGGGESRNWTQQRALNVGHKFREILQAVAPRVKHEHGDPKPRQVLLK